MNGKIHMLRSYMYSLRPKKVDQLYLYTGVYKYILVINTFESKKNE
jgi:hypothetical protein